MMTADLNSMNALSLLGKEASTIQSFIQQIIFQRLSQKPLEPKYPKIVVVSDSSAFENQELQHTLSLTREGLVILNLEDSELIRVASETPLPVQWFSTKDPKDLAGNLLDHYQGTYWNIARGQIIYQSDSHLETFVAPSLVKSNTRENGSLAAAICASRALGIRPETIQAYFNTQIRPFQNLNYTVVPEIGPSA
jgi:hypothetical protein